MSPSSGSGPHPGGARTLILTLVDSDEASTPMAVVEVDLAAEEA